jgi:hypothetical protein
MPGNRQTLVFAGLSVPASLTPSVAVTFANHGTHDATLFFDPADGLVLRRPAGTFAGNYLRALAQLYLRLALFAAIGVTLGTLFSMPVATFLTLVLILILQLSGFVSAAAQVDRETFVANVAPFGADAHSHGDGRDPVAIPPSPLARGTATALYYAYRGTYLALRPLLDDRTLDDLSTGTHLPPAALLRNTLQQGLLLPLLLALLSTAVLQNANGPSPLPHEHPSPHAPTRGSKFFHSVENFFPLCGKFANPPPFSIVWKNRHKCGKLFYVENSLRSPLF